MVNVIERVVGEVGDVDVARLRSTLFQYAASIDEVPYTDFIADILEGSGSESEPEVP